MEESWTQPDAPSKNGGRRNLRLPRVYNSLHKLPEFTYLPCLQQQKSHATCVESLWIFMVRYPINGDPKPGCQHNLKLGLSHCRPEGKATKTGAECILPTHMSQYTPGDVKGFVAQGVQNESWKLRAGQS